MEWKKVVHLVDLKAMSWVAQMVWKLVVWMVALKVALRESMKVYLMVV